MSSFPQQVRAALDAPDAALASRRVHEVVAAQLRRLDPDVDIETTGYFNHSSIPDFVLSWSQEGAEGMWWCPPRRPVFLRHLLRSSRAAGDLNSFSRPSESTIYLSLSPHEAPEDTRLVRDSAAAHPQTGVLLTTIATLGALLPPTGISGPLLPLIQNTFVRCAKGAIFSYDVRALLDTSAEPRILRCKCPAGDIRLVWPDGREQAYVKEPEGHVHGTPVVDR